jgi:hypothetical protein
MHKKSVTVISCDARSILTAMLQEQQRVINKLICGILGSDADYATHGGLLNNKQFVTA